MESNFTLGEEFHSYYIHKYSHSYLFECFSVLYSSLTAMGRLVVFQRNHFSHFINIDGSCRDLPGPTNMALVMPPAFHQRLVLSLHWPFSDEEVHLYYGVLLQTVILLRLSQLNISNWSHNKMVACKLSLKLINYYDYSKSSYAPPPHLPLSWDFYELQNCIEERRSLC